MYQQHSLEIFQHYFKKDTKVWFSPVTLIYSHSVLHNINSNCTCVNAYFFVFNRMRLFYSKEKLTIPFCHGGKNMKKQIFQ